MTVSTPARKRLGRVINHARGRRERSLDRAALHSELVAYQTTSELSELSAIAARNPHVDTSELRTVLSSQLSR
jgi:hypothetical protein